jgi:peptidoglycan/xylan/chitin deacetylase (PgdA/CDA1 family)
MSGRALRWLMTLMRPAVVQNGDGPPRLTILRHHRVYADGAQPLYRLGVAESVLAAQLDLLVRLGLRPLTVAEGLAALDRNEPGHRVALSFDDGYADNLHRALPLLRARAARATFYLTAGLMERREPAWWDQVAGALERTRSTTLKWTGDHGSHDLPLGNRSERGRALDAILPDFRCEPAARADRIAQLCRTLAVADPAPCEFMTWDEAAVLRDAGMELGAHTLTHPHLSLLDEAGQHDEIAGSVTLIERRLSVHPTGLAYPGGDHDARTIAVAQRSGLSYAVTTRTGDNRPGAPRFQLQRRGFNEGACLGPTGRFSNRLAMAELEGAFDRLRGAVSGSAS